MTQGGEEEEDWKSQLPWHPAEKSPRMPRGLRKRGALCFFGENTERAAIRHVCAYFFFFLLLIFFFLILIMRHALHAFVTVVPINISTVSTCILRVTCFVTSSFFSFRFLPYSIRRCHARPF